MSKKNCDHDFVTTGNGSTMQATTCIKCGAFKSLQMSISKRLKKKEDK